MHTINSFKSELVSVKDQIGAELVPALEDLSNLIDESVTVLNGVEVHNMDIERKELKSVITLINDEIATYKQIVKGIDKIKFAEIWSEEKLNSLKAIKEEEDAAEEVVVSDEEVSAESELSAEDPAEGEQV
tara:strand:- start:397 stop:789 length:393 start_codon:yes stop_codon:yes gene_type:complete